MKFRIKFKKTSSSLVTMLALALFVWLAVVRLDLPIEKVYQWALLLFVLLFMIIALGALVAWLIRWSLREK